MMNFIKLVFFVSLINRRVQELRREALVIKSRVEFKRATVGDARRLKEIFAEKDEIEKFFNLLLNL